MERVATTKHGVKIIMNKPETDEAHLGEPRGSGAR